MILLEFQNRIILESLKEKVELLRQSKVRVYGLMGGKGAYVFFSLSFLTNPSLSQSFMYVGVTGR